MVVFEVNASQITSLEEAYKQIQILRREVSAPSDLPQAIIHFKQLTANYLEFIITLVNPIFKHSVTLRATRLPPSVRFSLHFIHTMDSPFPYEMSCFSLFLPAHYFKESDTVNLLGARECIVRYLDYMLGPFRDYNGGLLNSDSEKIAPLSGETI